DDPLVRTGIVRILDTGPAIVVVAQAADGAEALRKIDAHRLDVALFDIRLPGMSGLGALQRLRSGGSARPCLSVTAFGYDDAVAGRGAFFAPSVARRLLDSGVSTTYTQYASAVERFERLTAREREILIRLSQGETNAEIAKALHLAPGTVKVHVSAILRKT